MAQRTRSQERLLQVIRNLKQEISAQDLYIELRKSNLAMGLATVYRALEALKLQGIVQVRHINGESLYSCTQKDTHHLTCLRCNRSFTLSECPVHHLETELQQTHQFKVFYHTLEFFGLCHQCYQREELETNSP